MCIASNNSTRKSKMDCPICLFDEAMSNLTRHFSNIFPAQNPQETTRRTIPRMEKIRTYHQKFDSFAISQLNVIPNYNINSTRKTKSEM